MSDQVSCAEHGVQEETFVCTHICDTLEDGIQRGFNWKLDEDGEFTAVCDGCHNASDDEWGRISGQVIRLLCLLCFKRAGEMNKVNMQIER